MSERMPRRGSASAVMTPSRDEIAAEIARLVSARGAGKTICPSDVARGLSEDWRVLMADVRRVAGEMAARGEIIVTQKGAVVDAATAQGPIRLGRP